MTCDTKNITDVDSVDSIELGKVFRLGGVIIYPTDTAYAIGCDATNEAAARKIFAIKGRAETKTLSLIAADVAMAEQWLEFSEKARALAQTYWPGPLGLILPLKKKGLVAQAVQDGCAGLRVPDNSIARALSVAAGVPIIATSANTSGNGPCYTLDNVRASLGDAFKKVDYAIDAGPLADEGVSTMVRVFGETIEIVRQGVVQLDA